MKPTVQPAMAVDDPTAEESATPQSRDWQRALVSLTDQVVVSATSFLTMMVLARTCSVAEYGVFHLAWTIINYLRTAQERLIANPYLVFVHQPGRDQRRLLGSHLVFFGILAVVCSLGIGIAAVVFAKLGRPQGLAPILVVLIISMPFILLRDLVRAINAAHFRFEQSLLLDIVIGLIQLSSLLALVYWEQVNTTAAAVLMGLACAVPCLYWLYRAPQPFQIETDHLPAAWRESWKYSRWLVAARAIGIGGFYLVPWMVTHYLGEAQNGPFAACSGLVGLSLMFIMGANNFFQPRTVKAYHDGGVGPMVRTLFETFAVLAGALAVISFGFFVAGDWLLVLINGAKYAGYGQVVFLLSLGMLAVCASNVGGNGLAALGRPRGYFWGEFAYFVAATSLAWWLIPRYELLGAAWALIGGGLAASVVTTATVARLVWLQTDRPPTKGAA